MLPLHVRVDLGAVAMKGYLQWSLTIRLFNVISRTLAGEGFYYSAERRSMFSTDPVNWM